MKKTNYLPGHSMLFTGSIMNLFFIVVFMFSNISSYGQENIFCGTENWIQKMKSNPEEYSQYLEELRKFSVNVTPRQANSNVADTIAVVVHVLWNTSTQNISDAVINRQIEILNEDFRRLNSDTANTPAPFKSVAGASTFYFQLARRLPSGALFNGINRVYTNVSSFPSSVNVYRTSSGGVDQWANCLNMYCCDFLASGNAGYANIPGTRCIIDYRYWGDSNINDVGRAGTHEVGHALGLSHLWRACTGDDGFTDTPQQYQQSSFCSTFPRFDSCTTGGNGIMFMNYMDYSSGICRNLFTIQQLDSAKRCVDQLLPHLYNSPLLAPVHANDAGVKIQVPEGSACNGANVRVQIRNWGFASLTSLTINYQLDNGSVGTHTWNGSLANFQTENVYLPSINTTSGLHQLKVFTTNPNGFTDFENSNDTSMTNFLIGGVSAPFFEGFEGSTFPPANWSSIDEAGVGPFLQTPWAFYNGNYAAVSENFANSTTFRSGTYNDLGFSVDFSGIPSPQLSFFVAYSYNSTLGYTDTLEIMVSNDCGETFASLYKKFNLPLLTAPVITSNFNFGFYPTSSEWRKDSINLSAYGNLSNVLVKFRNITGAGYQLYLDDINIMNQPVGIDEIDNEVAFSLYPNPALNKVEITFNTELKNSRLTMYNVVGTEVLGMKLDDGKKQQSLNISELPPSIYIVLITTGEKYYVQKLLIE